MARKPDAQAFLAAIGSASEREEAGRPPSPAPEEATTRSLPSKGRGKGRRPRSDLIHFGGYLDSATFEKIALLRLRLKKDNSELIELAIDDLFRKHSAKRAFGDV